MKIEWIVSRRRPQGFTLVEVLVVVAIIAALAAILIPIVSSAKKRAAAAQAQAVIGAIKQGLEGYHSDFAMYPPSAGGGAAALARALNGDGSTGAPVGTGFYMQKANAGGGISQVYG